MTSYAPNANQMPTGYYMLISKSLGKCLDANTHIPKQYHTEYPRCHLADVTFASSQRWLVVNKNETTENGENIYLIFSSSNTSLDGCIHDRVPQYDRTSPSPFLAAHDPESTSQQWLLVQPNPSMALNAFYVFCRQNERLIDANVDRAKHYDTRHMSPFIGARGYTYHANIQLNKVWQFVPWPDTFLDPVVPSGRYMICNRGSGHYMCLAQSTSSSSSSSSKSGNSSRSSSRASSTIEMKLPDFAGTTDTIWSLSYTKSPNEYSIQMSDQIVLEAEFNEYLSAAIPQDQSKPYVKPFLRPFARNVAQRDQYRWSIRPTSHYKQDGSVYIVNDASGMCLNGSTNVVDVRLGAVNPPFLSKFVQSTSDPSQMWQLIPTMHDAVCSPTEENGWKLIDLKTTQEQDDSFDTSAADNENDSDNDQ